jgi:Flp pilus assembly protein TadD
VGLATDVLDQAPGDPEVNGLIAAIHIKSGAVFRAIPFLRQLVQSDPENAEYRYRLGLALVKNGDLGNGNRELRRALQMDPSRPEAAEARAALRRSTK